MKRALLGTLLLGLTGLLLAGGCAQAEATAPVRTVYLACELSQDGRVLARPQLLADVGTPVRVHQRGQTPYDLQLRVRPVGARFQLALDLSSAAGAGRAELTLAHDVPAEVLVDRAHGLRLKVLLLRVPSPELDERLLHDVPQRTSVLSI